MAATVYAMLDKDRIVYVGKTEKRLSERAVNHVFTASKYPERILSQWVNRQKSIELVPLIELGVVDSCKSRLPRLEDRERREIKELAVHDCMDGRWSILLNVTHNRFRDASGKVLFDKVTEYLGDDFTGLYVPETGIIQICGGDQ